MAHRSHFQASFLHALIQRDMALDEARKPCCTEEEIEGYVWDSRKSELGQDAPLKKKDHAADALRYAIFTHKVPRQMDYGTDFGRTLGR